VVSVAAAGLIVGAVAAIMAAAVAVTMAEDVITAEAITAADFMAVDFTWATAHLTIPMDMRHTDTVMDTRLRRHPRAVITTRQDTGTNIPPAIADPLTNLVDFPRKGF
jgi:hypothetical protein